LIKNKQKYRNHSDSCSSLNIFIKNYHLHVSSQFSFVIGNKLHQTNTEKES